MQTRWSILHAKPRFLPFFTPRAHLAMEETRIEEAVEGYDLAQEIDVVCSMILASLL
jgi:hypothetical protein